MNSEVFFFPSIFASLGISFVALILLAVTAMHDAKQGGNKAAIVKRGYIYLVSFITLLLIGVSLINLLDLGLRSTVLTKADPMMGYYSSPPPGLYLTPASTKAEVAPAFQTNLTCDNGCTLTDAQKTDIKNWEQNYQSWQQSNGSATNRRAQSLVTPLSFLIIAGLAFLFHWRWVRKDRNEMDEASNLTRSTYFTAMSFVWLLTLIISAGFLLNTTLRAVIPGAEQSKVGISPMTVSSTDQQAVESMVTCGEKCGLSASTIALAEQWKTDSTTWTERQNINQPSRDRQNALATELAFFIVALPLFWFHYRTAWLKKKQSPPTSVA